MYKILKYAARNYEICNYCTFWNSWWDSSTFNVNHILTWFENLKKKSFGFVTCNNCHRMLLLYFLLIIYVNKLSVNFVNVRTPILQTNTKNICYYASLWRALKKLLHTNFIKGLYWNDQERKTLFIIWLKNN